MEKCLGAEELKSYRCLEKELPARGEKFHETSEQDAWFKQKKLGHMLDEQELILKEPRVERLSHLAVGCWLPEPKMVKVLKENGKGIQNLGTRIDGIHMLYPEEALYLLDMKHMEIYYKDYPLSLQEAFVLLLHDEQTMLKHQVYSHLRRLGYTVVKHNDNPKAGIPTEYEKQINLHRYTCGVAKSKKLENDVRPISCANEEPKPSVSSEENTKPDVSSANGSKPDLSSTSEPKPDLSSTSEPKPVLSSTSEPKPDLSSTSEPKPDLSSTSEPKPDLSSTNEPKPDVSSTNEPKPDVSSTEAGCQIISDDVIEIERCDKLNDVITLDDEDAEPPSSSRSELPFSAPETSVKPSVELLRSFDNYFPSCLLSRCPGVCVPDVYGKSVVVLQHPRQRHLPRNVSISHRSLTVNLWSLHSNFHSKPRNQISKFNNRKRAHERMEDSLSARFMFGDKSCETTVNEKRYKRCELGGSDDVHGLYDNGSRDNDQSWDRKNNWNNMEWGQNGFRGANPSTAHGYDRPSTSRGLLRTPERRTRDYPNAFIPHQSSDSMSCRPNRGSNRPDTISNFDGMRPISRSSNRCGEENWKKRCYQPPQFRSQPGSSERLPGSSNQILPDDVPRSKLKTEATSWAQYKLELEIMKNKPLNNKIGSALLTTNKISPLITPKDATSTAAILAKLQIVPQVQLTKSVDLSSQVDSNCINISYDVFLPNTDYRKRIYTPPNHRLVVLSGFADLPELYNIALTVKRLGDQIPLHFAVVDNGDIAFYSFNDVSLPIQIAMG